MLVTFGEVESEGGLIGAEVIDVEDELFGEVGLAPPDDPPNSGVDEPVFVSAHVDALH